MYAWDKHFRKILIFIITLAQKEDDDISLQYLQNLNIPIVLYFFGSAKQTLLVCTNEAGY
jgi:hypothetical protein